ncbi:873_t:CDS:2 [Entrophospora sp. SA101]|nr:873_t:CDS:2 [Entrophospora sp. SA101]
MDYRKSTQSFNEFNGIDLLTVHFYDASILEKHNEGSMKVSADWPGQLFIRKEITTGNAKQP